METLFRRCGFIFRDGSQPNQLTQDQALFQKQVTDHFHYNQKEAKQIAEEFVNHIEDKKNLFFTLYTTTSVGSSNARCVNQDSLVHLLLGIPQLQQLITDAMFEKLAELSGFDESFTWEGTNYSLTFLIVKQFKFINNVVYSQDLCNKILEILDVVTEETQQNIINSFPEILNDEFHPTVAKTLSGYLSKSTPLTINILETLGSLNIPPDLLSEINDSAAVSTAWMKCEYLPVIIRFLYNTSDEEHMENITRTVRDNLAESGFNQQISGQQNHVIIILDQLKFFIQIRKSVGDAWIRVIEANISPDTQIVDFLVVLILFSMPNRQQSICSLLRQKIQNAHFNHKLIRTVLNDFSWALKDYFDPIMQISEWCLKQTSENVTQFGHYVYKYSFAAFDMAYKQEVVEHLLSHFSSVKSSEVDSAIEILMDLVNKETDVMSSFAIYIKRLIDRLDQMTFSQLKLVFECLSKLACSGTHEGETIQHDLQMIIQKQITNKELRYKRFGVVGALTFLANLASPNVNDEETKRAKSLLELILEGVKSEKLATALFYDELSNLITKCKLNKQIEEWIYQNVIVSFQDNFILEVDRTKSEDISYRLEKDEDGAIAIDLLTLVTKEVKFDNQSLSPMLLSPQFRLVRIYESLHEDGSLESIDALLGCGLGLFPMHQIDKFQTLSVQQKDTICNVLFHCVNWFREIVNGFATQKDPEMKNKVLIRLKNIVYFENVLRKCLTHHSKFNPPLAQFDTDEKNDLKRKRESASSDKPKKKAKIDSSSSEKTATQNSVTTQTTQVSGKVKKKKETKAKVVKEKELVLVSLSKYQQFLRKLDFDVFQLLDAKVDYKDSEDALSPTELIFLLEDLKLKLETNLRSSARNNPFGNSQKTSRKSSGDVFRRAVDLIPFMCAHLETAYGYFQENLAGSQDMIDAARTNLCESIAYSFNLLLQCLSTIFNWREIDEEFEEIRDKAVIHVSHRLSTSSGCSQLSFEDHVARALDYVIKFARLLPTFACATGVLSLATSLSKINRTESHHSKIGKLAVDFLKQPWFDRDGNSERGLRHYEYVQQTLTMALQMNSDAVKLLQDITSVAFAELLENEDESNSYRTLNKFTFATYYRVLFLTLIKEAKKIPAKKENGSAILQWRLCVEIFHILVNAIKVFNNQTCMITCVKCSRSFVESFVKLGIPVLETGFKRHKDDVLALLRTFQMSTRFLQHLCCHAKIVKQLATTKHIPPLRKNLEAFLYRVKAMLALYNCQDAFWLGNLKNKDIAGEEIPVDNGDDERKEDEQETEQQAEEVMPDIPEELLGSDNSDDENHSTYSQSF